MEKTNLAYKEQFPKGSKVKIADLPKNLRRQSCRTLQNVENKYGIGEHARVHSCSSWG
jgi:hypothetical protein